MGAGRGRTDATASGIFQRVTVVPPHIQVIELAETDSTMAEAARRAPEVAGPTWILAERQTAAKGRRGRDWVQPKGNFSATLLLPPGPPPDQMALRSFVAALALDRALSDLTGRPEAFALKWPNDVLLLGGKLAGILLESLPTGHLSVGIGVNLAAAPGADQVEPGATHPVSLAEAMGITLLPKELMGPLATHFDALDTQLTQFGFAPIRTAWLARAARLGEVITARTVTESQQGTFETVDGTGQLVLSTAKGRVLIAAADVYF